MFPFAEIFYLMGMVEEGWIVRSVHSGSSRNDNMVRVVSRYLYEKPNVI